MGNQANSREERAYFRLESVFGTAEVPQAGDAVLFTRMDLNPVNQLIPRPDKTGSRGRRPGTRGRQMARWGISASLPTAANAAAAPPIEPLLVAIFGQAPAVGANRVYTLTDTAIKSLTGYSYRSPATMAQRCGVGLTVTQFTFDLGGDVAMLSISGEGKYCIISDQWAALDTAHRCGLANFPVEPTPDYTDDYGMIIGFTGDFTVGGVSIPSIQRAQIRGSMGNMVRKDTFGQFLPDGTEGADRVVGISFTLYDEDEATTAGMLREIAETKVPTDIVMTAGTVAGGIYAFTLKGVQLAEQQLTDGSIRWIGEHPDSAATESAPAARDEFSLTRS